MSDLIHVLKDVKKPRKKMFINVFFNCGGINKVNQMPLKDI